MDDEEETLEFDLQEYCAVCYEHEDDCVCEDDSVDATVH